MYSRFQNSCSREKMCHVHYDMSHLECVFVLWLSSFVSFLSCGAQNHVHVRTTSVWDHKQTTNFCSAPSQHYCIAHSLCMYQTFLLWFIHHIVLCALTILNGAQMCEEKQIFLQEELLKPNHNITECIWICDFFFHFTLGLVYQSISVVSHDYMHSCIFFFVFFIHLCM